MPSAAAPTAPTPLLPRLRLPRGMPSELAIVHDVRFAPASGSRIFDVIGRDGALFRGVALARGSADRPLVAGDFVRFSRRRFSCRFADTILGKSGGASTALRLLAMRDTRIAKESL